MCPFLPSEGGRERQKAETTATETATIHSLDTGQHSTNRRRGDFQSIVFPHNGGYKERREDLLLPLLLFHSERFEILCVARKEENMTFRFLLVHFPITCENAAGESKYHAHIVL